MDTLIHNYQDRVNRTDLCAGQARLDRQYNRTKTMTKDKKEKSHRFAFLKISANTHLAHSQSHTSQLASQSFAKESNFGNAQTFVYPSTKLYSIWV